MNITKEQKLKERIEKAKQQLSTLQQKRKLEIGELAYQCGIADLADDKLLEVFTHLASQHVNHS